MHDNINIADRKCTVPLKSTMEKHLKSIYHSAFIWFQQLKLIVCELKWIRNILLNVC